MAKAIIYARRSTGKDAESSESIETQQQYCKDYCVKQGYEPVAYYEDRNLSGSVIDRPGLWNAVEACGKGYVLVAYRQDRLARDVYLAESVYRAISGKGATIETVKDSNLNGDSPEQTMLRQILAAFSEYERKIIAIRTKYAKLHHQKHGRRQSHLCPYGWKDDPNDSKRMIPDAREQELIQQMLVWHSEGISFRGIATRLNNLMEEDYETYMPRNAKEWNGKTINDIITREKAEGVPA